MFGNAVAGNRHAAKNIMSPNFASSPTTAVPATATNEATSNNTGIKATPFQHIRPPQRKQPTYGGSCLLFKKSNFGNHGQKILLAQNLRYVKMERSYRDVWLASFFA